MAQNKVDISIVVVNYNVKEHLANLLNSIRQARKGLKLEVIVIDNASTDGSKEYITHNFPEVRYIWNEENVGFGKANNQGIQLATGDYTLLLNPDTLLEEDTLITMKRYMDQNPETGAAGCKILNPDGTYSYDGRRSIPTLLSSFWKITGLTALFPKSKVFGQYYLGWLDEDEYARVPVISGAFMFCRTKVIKELGGFDERYFMYFEDTDLCFRITQNTGYTIDYVPDTHIIHFKGESTDKLQSSYSKRFNKALYQFFEKHYSRKYTWIVQFLILLGIGIRTLLSFVVTKFRSYKNIIADLAAINVILFSLFIWRYDLGWEAVSHGEFWRYGSINLLVSLLYIFFSNQVGLIRKFSNSISAALKAVLISFSGVVLITFFIRQWAFSRLVLVVGAFLSMVAVMAFRLWRKNKKTSVAQSSGKFTVTRILIVGISDQTYELIRRLRNRVDWEYEIVGVIGHNRSMKQPMQKIDQIPVLGSIEQIPAIVREYKIDQLFFMLNTITYKNVLLLLSRMRSMAVEAKLIPDNLDYILGKSKVDYLDDIPMLDIDLLFQSGWNQFIKRSLDLMVSTAGLIFLFPLLIRARGKKSKHQKKPVYFNVIGSDPASFSLFYPFEEFWWLNVATLLAQVFKGRISLVGAPLTTHVINRDYEYKSGITGLAQINRNRVFEDSDIERFDLHYLQNYSIWMDIDILIKALTARKHPLVYEQSGNNIHGKVNSSVAL